MDRTFSYYYRKYLSIQTSRTMHALVTIQGRIHIDLLPGEGIDITTVNTLFTERKTS